VRETFSVTTDIVYGLGISWSSDDFKAQFAVLVVTDVLEVVVEGTGPQLLPIFQHPKISRVSWRPGVDWTALNVPLAVAEGGPALRHLFFSI